MLARAVTHARPACESWWRVLLTAARHVTGARIVASAQCTRSSQAANRLIEKALCQLPLPIGPCLRARRSPGGNFHSLFSDRIASAAANTSALELEIEVSCWTQDVWVNSDVNGAARASGVPRMTGVRERVAGPVDSGAACDLRAHRCECAPYAQLTSRESSHRVGSADCRCQQDVAPACGALPEKISFSVF